MSPRRAAFLAPAAIALACWLHPPAPEPGPGHAVRLGGRDLRLVGVSATQAVLQNADFDIDAWLDDLARHGIRNAMVWSFMAARQTEDGRIVDARWGRVIPGIGPWRRDLPDPPASDGRPRWNLADLDEEIYWPRLRKLLLATRGRGMTLWITVFDGWTKERYAVPFHPFRVENGGPLAAAGDFVVLDTPGREIDTPDAPPGAWRRRNQWFQERFADRLAREVAPHDHVVLELFNEGERYDPRALLAHQRHFASFFRRRVAAPLAMNEDHVLGADAWREAEIDVVSWHPKADDEKAYRSFLAGFLRRPAKPLVCSENVPAYEGPAGALPLDAARRLVWAILMAGGHVFVQDDTAFAFDPAAPRADGEALRRQIGVAASFFGRETLAPGCAAPRPEVAPEGRVLACGDAHLVVHLPRGGRASLRLPRGSAYEAVWLDPRTGGRRPAGAPLREEALVASPDDGDWVLDLVRIPAGD